MIGETAAVIALLAAICSPFYKPLMHRATVFGIIGRSEDTWTNIHGEGLRIIPDTVACEDIHFHADSGMLFTACQNELETRPKWFPPMGHFDVSGAESRGSLVVIDPKKFTATHLSLTGFDGPLITHGLDVITGEDPATVYLFAINHLTNTTHTLTSSAPLHYAARSQIEVFRHVLGTSTAEYVRSVRHPLIITPNDILATSPTTFFVTNDHYYRSGMMRSVEDLLTEYLAGWSNTIHVQIMDRTPMDSEAGLTATVALTGLHNNNGLGISKLSDPNEILIGDASGGVILRARRHPHPYSEGAELLQVIERIHLDSTLDNPSWYADPYAKTGRDASGYVLAGLAHAIKLGDNFLTLDRPISSVVWHVRVPEVGMTPARRHDTFDKRVIFQDDGNTLRSASAAVMVGIDPQENGGRKQAWLFATGFVSAGVVATKVDL